MNEPVACIQDLNEVKRKQLVYEKGMDWKDPLYTHPVKEQLTNTEIADALYVADITLDNLSDGDIPIERINAFARAVIRKAQEK